MKKLNMLTSAAVVMTLLFAGCNKHDRENYGPNPNENNNPKSGNSHQVTPPEKVPGTTTPSPKPVALGLSGNYVILSKAGISTTGVTSIVGNIGVSPIAATAITGFGLILDRTGQFAKSPLVTGNIYAATYAVPTPANLTTAIHNMEAAYTDAAGRAANVTELGAGNIGGMTLAPGVYKWGTDVSIPTDVTLSGNSNAVWIFQIGGGLKISSAKNVILTGGAQAKNIFWQVAGVATLGTTSSFKGIILSKTAIVMQTGAVITGKALAQTAVTLDANKVK
jgi:hypothetical protein